MARGNSSEAGPSARLISALAALALVPTALAQTAPDPDFDASVPRPAFASGEGPRVLIDEGHNNWHTGTGRYGPLADVLRNDGYRVAPHRGAFTPASLGAADILIVASAIEDAVWRALVQGVDLDEAGVPSRPVPSAFSREEIDELVDWVRGGGGLFLVVDYRPLAGMSAELAAGFGVHIADGYAYDGAASNAIAFARTDGTLRAHPITDGRAPDERVETVRTFAGTAFLVPHGAEPLLLFDEPAYILLPEVLLPADTPPPADAPRHPIAGWSQGAALEFGEGRVVLLGEAAALSAQRFPGGGVTGMNHPSAAQNKQFLLNVLHWLAGVL